ncbi:MAG TPA: hypothetical protein VH880_08220 [Anaeromyxobacteraceae bacterium]
MRSIAIAIAIAAVAAVTASPARAAEPPSGAGFYSVDTAGSTQALRVGEKGKWVLSLRAKAPWHVDPRAPVKIRLEPGAGLAPERTALARKDAVDPRAESPRFEAPFSASAPGSHQAKAHLEFFLCRDTICERQTTTVALPVTVK